MVVILSLAASAYLLTGRTGWETSNRNYSLAFSYQDIKATASRSNLPVAEIIKKATPETKATIIFQYRKVTGSESLNNFPIGGNYSFNVGIEINSPGDITASDIASLGAMDNFPKPDLLIFDQPAGTVYRKEILSAIEKEGYPVGAVEFESQKISKYLVDRGYLGVVRVHRIFDRELGTETPDSSFHRFTKAVEERNIGVIQYRFLPGFNLEKEIEILDRLTTHLKEAGFSLVAIDKTKGLAGNFNPPKTLVIPFLLLNILLTGKLIRAYFPNIGRVYTTVVLGAELVGLSYVYIANFTLFQQGLGLLLAVQAPPLIYLVTKMWLSVEDPNKERVPERLKNSIKGLVFTSGLSTLAGFGVASILADHPYLLKIYQFRGVKLALLLPIVMVLALALREGNLRLGNLSYSLSGLAITGALGILVAFLLLRSGNFPFVPVASWEEQVREWLAQVLYVRPRFKEFVLGHPALMLLYFLKPGYNNPLVKGTLIVLGFVGQVSIINTFAHIHTPLITSIIRTINGLVLGALLGSFLLLCIWGMRKFAFAPE